MKKILITLLALVGVAFCSNALAIGMLTDPLIIENTLRGSEIIDSITLLNSENKEIAYELKAEGKIANWVSFYSFDDALMQNPITQVKLLPKGNVNVKVKIALPNSLPNGVYKGELAIYTIPVDNENSTSNYVLVKQRVGREVEINVTDKEITDLKASIIPLKYAVAKNKPLQIKMVYENNGNVQVRPDVRLVIEKAGQVIFEAVFPYPTTEAPVMPREQKTMDKFIEWQTAPQDNGKYIAKVQVLLNNEIIEENDFAFEVGFDITKLLGFISFLGGGNLTLAWFILAGIILAVACLLWIIYRFKMKKAVIT